MDYIKQLNEFHERIDLEPISIQARSLWITLTNIHEKLLWRESFVVSSSKLQVKAGLSQRAFKRGREELIYNGFIQVTFGDSNQSAVYRMVQLYSDLQSIKLGRRVIVNHKMSHKVSPLIKHKQKLK
ncbi:hypothetical protein BME96_15800 [Virgibacillus halodenitrificans]|uniref:Uncharacterized protein n=1 Tax=Virgibacillus halodenitrificans TaxID=1482 RepID=A0AAC9NLI4_VIRHA|nr:hypothetical protein [Virgibacillus halodenitrificans]APC49567.1 hypothetical protein BME96_15800 [Virgibacillus halodenitrificans]